MRSQCPDSGTKNACQRTGTITNNKFGYFKRSVTYRKNHRNTAIDSTFKEEDVIFLLETLGPLIVAMNVNDNFRQNYKGGVYFEQTACNSEDLNHNVLLVGVNNRYWTL